MRIQRRLCAALLPLALGACAATQPEPQVAAPVASTLDADRAIAEASAETALLSARMDEMLSKQAELQKLMLVMLDQAMSPEVMGALMSSAKQLETAFAEADLGASAVQ